MKIFSNQNQSFTCPKLGEDQTKRSSLKFSPVFDAKLGAGQKTKVFAHRLCPQTFCPSYTGGGSMPQFCILFYANYTILATQRGGPWPNAPPKYAPDSVQYMTCDCFL